MAMRTTVTLSEATHRKLKRRAADEGITFKAAVNNALEAGLAAPVKARPFKMKPVDMGEPLLPLDHTMRLVGELEDAELIRKMELGK